MANNNDTFTRAADALLTAHTSDSGHTYTKGSTGDITVVAATDKFYGLDSHLSLHYSSAVPASAEYDVNLEVFVAATGDRSCGPVGRKDTAADTCYFVYWRGTDGEWNLVREVTGTQTALAVFGGDAPTTARTLKLEIRDATKKLFIGGVERISSTDNTITAAGRSGAEGGSLSTSTGDNLSSTDVAAGTATNSGWYSSNRGWF